MKNVGAHLIDKFIGWVCACACVFAAWKRVCAKFVYFQTSSNGEDSMNTLCTHNQHFAAIFFGAYLDQCFLFLRCFSFFFLSAKSANTLLYFAKRKREIDWNYCRFGWGLCENDAFFFLFFSPCSIYKKNQFSPKHLFFMLIVFAPVQWRFSLPFACTQKLLSAVLAAMLVVVLVFYSLNVYFRTKLHSFIDLLCQPNMTWNNIVQNEPCCSVYCSRHTYPKNRKFGINFFNMN